MEALCTVPCATTSTVVRRVNQLYHDLTQHTFDADHRARHAVERVFWNTVAQSFVTQTTPSGRGRIVVDLACGTGFVTQILARTLRSSDRLIAMDISTAALRTTTGKCLDSESPSTATLTAMASDGGSIPLADDSVDLFAINAALHHMPEPETVLREINRVLRPGGLFALGFEPNLRHFASAMGRVSHGFDRLAWYASPRQNLRRLRKWIGLTPKAERNPALEADRIAAVISDSLAQAHCLQETLDGDAMLDLVDPHARGAQHAGFDALAVIHEFFPTYEPLQLFTSDYLGEAPRQVRPLRTLADAGLRAWLPAHGSLFSWVLRKPSLKGGACPR